MYASRIIPLHFSRLFVLYWDRQISAFLRMKSACEPKNTQVEQENDRPQLRDVCRDCAGRACDVRVKHASMWVHATLRDGVD